MDGTGILGPDPRRPNLPPISAARRLGTNHFCGYGWWCWVIPLAGGETSIGVVYNKDLFELGGPGSAIENYRAFLEGQPGLRELIRGARLNEDDFVQTFPPTYDPAASQVAEVRQVAPDHVLVVMEPEDRVRYGSLETVTVRYQVKKVGQAWRIDLREESTDGEEFKKVAV